MHGVTRLLPAPGAPAGRYGPPRYVRVADAQRFFDSFNRLREGIATEFPDVAPDLAPPRHPDPGPANEGLMMARDVTALLDDTAHTVELLKVVAMHVALPRVEREGLFIAGQEFDAFRQIGKILSGATRTLSIIDGYIDETVLDLVSRKGKGVGVMILTFKVDPPVRAAAQKFNKQYGGLAIRTSSAFHDRFLILDDSDFFHFGASIKDAGRRGFMFTRIDEPSVIGPFRD